MQTQMTDIDTQMTDIYAYAYMYKRSSLSKEPTNADADDRYRYAGERHQ